jgi:hypothetical protein
MLRIDAAASRELQAVILALKQADKEVQKQVRTHTKGSILPEGQKGIREHVSTRMEHRVLADTARVTVSNQNVTLKAGGLQKRLSGGARASEIYAPVEFGTNREHKKGNRHTRRQFRPMNRKGYAVYPTAADLIPRFAALWVQTTVRTMHEIFERR